MFFVGTVTDAENPGIARLPADYAGLSRYHFHIDEMFSGPETAEVDLISTRGGGDCSAHFKVGEQYMIHAYQAHGSSWSTSICSGNRKASEAAVYLSELRARRRGEKFASLYGVVRRIQQPYSTVVQSRYEEALGGVHIRLTDEQRTLETISDQSGRYFFYDLPGGKYQVAAQLPVGLELGQTILTNPLPPLTISDHACMEHDLNALPKTRITGRVLEPSGKPLDYASIKLYRAELYGKTESTFNWDESQKNNKPFEFVHVAPGDYVLVFNEQDSQDPDQPFPRTFYGDVHEFAEAKHITVSEADEVVTADFHLKGGQISRQITLRVLRNDGQLDDDCYFQIKPSLGTRPFPKKASPGIYTLNILKDAKYTISAQDLCFSLRSRVESDSLTVSGGDSDIHEVTLVLPRGPCPKQKGNE